MLACDLHDYFEIVCMFHYQVNAHLKDGSNHIGKAVDIKTKKGEEYLVLKAAVAVQEVSLSSIKKIEVITPNARFKQIVL